MSPVVKMKPEHFQNAWNPLIEHLRTIQPFHYVHNFGNAGDTLIYKGMVELFAAHTLSYEELFIGPGQPLPHPLHLVFSGGGNLIPLYRRCRDLIADQFDSIETFTLLPHTVDGNVDLLQRLDSRFFLFCREPTSFAHCQKHTNPSVTVKLSHDLAFALSGGNSLTPPKPAIWFPSVGIDRQWRWIKKQRRVARFIQDGGRFFFREDKEAPSAALPSENLDVSLELSAIQRRQAQRLHIADTMLYQMSRANQIQTNRLHLAIAGALLAKPTRLFPGSYFKNEAVFCHSIAPAFPGVQLCGFPPERETMGDPES